MQQYFINEIININSEVILPKDVMEHFFRVLRMKDDQEIYLVDSLNKKYLCKIKEYKAIVIKEIVGNYELPIKVTIVQALIKNDNFDYFVKKSSELGVSTIVPLVTKRTIVKTNEKSIKKLERYQKIAFEASCQCKRNIVPKVNETINLKDIIKYKSDINLVCYEDLNYPSFKLRDLINQNQSITIVIGPEGGFDLSEVEFLRKNDFKCINLGPRILRAETAGLYCLSVVSGLLE